MPVKDDGDRFCFCFNGFINKKPAISGYSVLLSVRGTTGNDRQWKKRCGYTCSKSRGSWRRCNRGCHQLSIWRYKVKFLSVWPPSHLNTSTSRYLPLSVCYRKWLDNDFKPGGFICFICDPMSIRRKLSVEFFEGCRNDRNRFSISSGERHCQ